MASLSMLSLTPSIKSINENPPSVGAEPHWFDLGKPMVMTIDKNWRNDVGTWLVLHDECLVSCTVFFQTLSLELGSDSERKGPKIAVRFRI